MKKNFRLLLAAVVACALLITASASAIVSPALNVLSKRNTLIKSGLVYSLRSRWNNHRGLIIVLASTSFLSGGFGIESTAAVAHGEATRDNNLSGFVAFML